MKTKSAPKKSSNRTARSLEQMSTGRRGQFLFTLDQLSLPEDYNPRKEFKGIPELAESILTSGLLQPLTVRKIKGTEIIEVLDGERRFRALTHLAEQGHDTGLIPCISEQQGTSDLDRDLLPLVANSGQDLTFLEKAYQYQRIMERHGIKAAELARRCQTTKQSVSDSLRLTREASPKILAAITKGTIAATTALQIIKQTGEDHAAQNELLATAQANSTGNHISPKHIPTPPPQPKDEPKQPSENQKSEINNQQSSIKPESPTDPSENPETKNQELGTKNTEPHFTLYQIEDAPTAPADKAGATYHETDRLVLSNPPTGITLLHILSAVTTEGKFCYGYRINHIERLPSRTCDSYEREPEDGLNLALDQAFAESESPAISDDDKQALASALWSAICDYYPEEGEAKPAESIAFTPPHQENGYDRIKNAPSSNRDGSSGGSSEPKFSPPDKQMEKLEKLLDELDEKGTGSAGRIETTEIIMDFLKNTRPLAEVRKHLSA